MTSGGPLFVDTWGWLALGHRRDPHHEEIRLVFADCQTRRQRMHTSDYVLDELITLLFRRESYSEAVHFLDGLLASAARGSLHIHRVTPERFRAALDLRRRFQDKPGISFTDFTTMQIMKEQRIIEVITEDEHFSHVGMGFRRIP